MSELLHGYEDLVKLRDMGWSVSAHNDYRLEGEHYTFYRFDKGHLSAKGEGKSDYEALQLALDDALAAEAEQATIHGAYCDLAELIKKANTGVAGNCEALEALIAQRDKLRAELERVKHGLHACIYQDEEGRMEILAVLRDSITLEGTK